MRIEPPSLQSRIHGRRTGFARWRGFGWALLIWVGGARLAVSQAVIPGDQVGLQPGIQFPGVDSGQPNRTDQFRTSPQFNQGMFGNPFGNPFGGGRTGQFNRGFGDRGGDNQRFGFNQFDRSTGREGRFGQSRTDRGQSRADRQRGRTDPSGRTPTAAAKPPEGAPDRARPGARPVVPRAAAGAGRAPARPAPPPLPRIQIPALIQADALFFSSPEVAVGVGQRFASPILFYNINQRPVEELDLWLKFDPTVLEPLWVDLAEIEDRLESEPATHVWRDRGYIRVRGRLKTPLTRVAEPLAMVHWQAGARPAETAVAFAAPEGEDLGLFSGGLNVVGAAAVGNEGLVSLRVRVLPEAPPDEPYLILSDEAPASAGEGPSGRGVHLGLIPAAVRVFPGEVSTIDVVLINPDVVAFDELRFRIRFDPQAVEILDADQDNYIAHGLNVYDGGFHETMPFERYERNSVDPVAGVIDYVAGSQRGPRPYPSGTVARIVWRLRREAGSAPFWFEGLDPLSGRYLSDVRVGGKSLLGPAGGRPTEGLHGVVVQVAPL